VTILSGTLAPRPVIETGSPPFVAPIIRRRTR
jgi:hypothetical protein